MNRALLITCLLMLFLSASCRATAPVKEAPAYTGPVSSEALRARIAFSGITGLRAEVRAVIWKNSRRVGAFKGALVMRPPDDMRVVLYDTFGNTAIDIVRADGSIEILVPSKDSMYVGEAPSMFPQVGSEMILATVEREDGRSVYELSSVHEDRELRRYEFDVRSALNTSASVLSDNGRLMEARFSGYAQATGDNIPENLTLRYGPYFRLELSITDPETGEVPARLIPLGRTASSIYDISELEAAE